MHPEKCAIFPVCGVVDFATVETLRRFPAIPTTRHAINKIIYPVFNTFDFKAIQAAIICNAFPAFTILSFVHRSNPFQNGMV